MKNELKIFSSEEFGNVRVVEINGEGWLVGKDVAEKLGYENPSKALKDHIDDEDKLNNKTLSSLGQRGGWLINESGLYSLVLSSKLPSAKKFKRWVTSEVLPTIRKTGGYVNNSDLMVQTYFGNCDETSKLLLKGLLSNIENQQKEIVMLNKEITHKEDVIIGLTTDIDLAEKRQRISQIVRHGSKKYQDRYNLLYSEFDKKFHINTQTRLENAKDRGEVKKATNRMGYICDYMNRTNELYDVATKIFEGDFIQLLDEWRDIAS